MTQASVIPTRRSWFTRIRVWWLERQIAMGEGNNVYLERQIKANNRDIDRMRIELARMP